MIAQKHITRVVALLMALAVFLCLLAVAFSGQLASAAGDTGITMEYESALFDTKQVMQVNILMDEAEWADMLENASAEEYYACDVEINGERFYRVGIRPKGNTSLSSIVSDPTTDRYSFKLEFDQYVDGQTCFGLDKLILNNNYADATNMKEALIYDMFQYIGADAPLYNYAAISVNGEYWGVYLALEAVEESFLLRNYGVGSGALYKPDSMNVGGGMGGGNRDFADMDFSNLDFGNLDFGNMDFGNLNFGNFDFGNADFTNAEPPSNESGDGFAVPQGGQPSEMPDTEANNTLSRRENGESKENEQSERVGGMGGFSMGSGGANLNYSDDDLDSYSTIWEGEVTKTTEADHERVVTALKKIAEGADLECYMDIDNLLRYMAVHIFSVNEDSLSGSMAHNYYLYEKNGRLNLIPWDYNLSFGGMSGGTSGTSVVNSAIDDAFDSTDFFDTLMENESYHAQYYAYLTELVEGYINGGGLDAFYNRVRGQIDALVEADPTAFYSYEEYTTAAETLYQLVKRRGQSVAGQVAGTIPSTESGQRNAEGLIDGSDLNISVMGSMMGGNGGGQMPNAGFGGNGGMIFPTASNTDSGEGMPTPPTQDGQMWNEGSSQFRDGDTAENEGVSSMPQDMRGQGQSGNTRPSRENGTDEGADDTTPTLGEMPDIPTGGGFPNGITAGGSDGRSNTLLLYGVSLGVFLLALLFALCYRRKPGKS